MKSLKKKLAGILAMTMLVGAAATAATPSPAAKVEPVAQTATVGKVTVKTTAKGEATITKVNTKKKKVTVPMTVTVDGVKYTVKTIGKKSFKGLKKNATVSINTKKSLKVAKGTFKGLDTKKVVIKVNKKMSKKQLKAFKKQLKAAGFKGTVKKAL